ncbi:MAG: ABC transporter substrate-binding protein [Desulfobacteraceae bacterium]|nr:MAG: ABC transporter substrate-binding protein [Desulfobacteraceae bacterium]
MKKALKLLCIFSCLVFLGATVVAPAYAENIKVGVILPLIGKLAKFGKIEQKSFLMAVDEINAAGGVNGNRIDLIIEDTEGRPVVGRSAIEKLILQDKVVVVGGGWSSSVTWAAATVAQQRKVPFLVNTASADKITEQGWGYIFRINSPVSEHPRALASFLSKVANVKTASILHENTLSGEFGVKKFVELCEKLNIEVVMIEGYEAGATELYPFLLKAKEKDPDLVYMNSRPMDASLLMQQAQMLDFIPKLYVGNAGGFTLPEFQRNAGEAAEYVYSATLWTPSVLYPGAKEYYDKFAAKYNTPPGYHGAQAYAAMYVIADALKRAKPLTPKGVRDALAETELMTVFGPVQFVSYGKKTQQNRLPNYLVQWINGKREIVWPKEVATARYIYPAPK